MKEPFRIQYYIAGFGIWKWWWE